MPINQVRGTMESYRSSVSLPLIYGSYTMVINQKGGGEDLDLAV